MELSKSFDFDDWTIKYGIFSPSTSPSHPLKTILFVHGTPWSSKVFHPLAKALLSTNKYRVILYDLPGYGESQHEENSSRSNEDILNLFEKDMRHSTSVKTQAAALTALLRHIDLDTADMHVIAHDIAGAIILRTHLIHAIDLASMMLLETNTVLPWGDGFYKLARARPEAFIEMPPSIFESVVRAVIRSGSHNPKTFPSRWQDALVEPWTGEGWRQRSFVRQIAQADDGDVREMLDGAMYERVRCDVKILWGESDSWIPRSKMEELQRMLGERCKSFVVVPEAGHLVMIDQPERVTVEVVEWLGGLHA